MVVPPQRHEGTLTVTSLPLRLNLMDVEIVGEHERTEVRWTIGPSWYEENVGDEFVPYYDDGRGGYSDVCIEGAQRWAERMIHKTSDYRVTGWNGRVPSLEVELHQLEIWTTAGVRSFHTITASEAGVAIRSLWDKSGVIALHGADGSDTYIPVSAVATINRKITRKPVVNE